VLGLLAGEDERLPEAPPEERSVRQEAGRNQGQPCEPLQAELAPVAEPLEEERDEENDPEVAG
jgi:hypothetical protein